MLALILSLLISDPAGAMTNTQSNSVMIMDIAETHGGTGFYLNTGKNSYIITNAHVCGNDSIKLIDPEDGEAFHARVLFQDKEADLCAIESKIPHKGFKLGNRTECGEWVLVPGYPELQPYTVRVAEKCDRVILTEIKHGNSGSPILNLDLEVIGVLNQMFLDSGMGHLIPLVKVKEFLKGK